MHLILKKSKIIKKVLACLFLLIIGWNDANAEFLVALDIGHTPDNPGATSARGRKEYYFNKEIAIRVNEALNKRSNLASFIINLKGKNIALKKRTEIAKMRKADLFLSLHHDSVQPHYLHEWFYDKKRAFYSDNFEGYSIFISNKNINNEESQELAIIIGKHLLGIGLKPTLHHSEPIIGENRKLLNKEKGVYEFNDLVVLKTSPMPALLLECGIIVNRKEELLIMGKEFKSDVSQAIVKAIVKYAETHTNFDIK